MASVDENWHTSRDSDIANTSTGIHVETVYSRLRFHSKIPSRVFYVSLRMPRRGGKFEQYRFSYIRKTAYSNDLRWRIVYQRIAMNLPLVKIAQTLNVAVSTVHRIYTGKK